MAKTKEEKFREKFLKKFGKGAILVKEEAEALAFMPYAVNNQCAMLLLTIGRPGFPAARITEINGTEATAKSTVGYHIIAECQRLGGIGILVENEDDFEISRLIKLGVDTDPEKLYLLQPDSMEKAIDMMIETINHIRVERGFDGPVVLLWDSVSTAATQAENEAEVSESTMASAARVLHKGLRKLKPKIGEHKIVAVFLNHLISNLDRYSGEKYISYGGKSIKNRSSLRFILKARKMDIELEGKEPLGQWIQAVNIKNKVGVPYKGTRFFLNFRKGIDQYRDVWNFGIAIDVFKEISSGRIKYKDKIITKNEWKKFVKKKWSDVYSCRDTLINRAIKKGILVPYGLQEKEEKKVRKKLKKKGK